MPYKPKRPCAHPGCPSFAAGDSQYCEKHEQIHKQNYDRYERSPNMNRKYGRAWKRIRDRYVKAHPLCELCLKEGRMTPVYEVHHIVPVLRGGRHIDSNLMSLCRSCHNKIHLQELGDRHMHE